MPDKLQSMKFKAYASTMKPLISLLKQKERHYENAIKALMKEEIPRSLHESGHSQSSRSDQVPVSAGQRFSHNTREGEVPSPCMQEESSTCSSHCFSWLSNDSSGKS